MAKFDRFVCAAEFANTGIGDCPIIPKHIVGMFIVPKDFEISISDAAALKKTLEDSVIEKLPKDRVLPVHGFVGVEDNSEDLVENTLGYGGISIIREGNYNLTFRLGKGGLSLQKALRKHNNKPMRVLLYDAGGMLFGVRNGSVMTGIPVDLFYATPMKLSDGSSEETSFSLRLVIKPVYLNDNLSYISTANEGFMLQEIEGLLDVHFTELSRALGVIKLEGFAAFGTINVFKEYATELGVVTAWIATSVADGTANVITSVAINDEGVATVTLTDDVDTNINLVDVTALGLLGVTGYEGRSCVSLKTTP